MKKIIKNLWTWFVQVTRADWICSKLKAWYLSLCSSQKIICYPNNSMVKSLTMKLNDMDLNFIGRVSYLEFRFVPWWWMSTSIKPSSRVYLQKPRVIQYGIHIHSKVIVRKVQCSLVKTFCTKHFQFTKVNVKLNFIIFRGKI